MKDKIKIDLPSRTEKRYLIPSSKNLMDRISSSIDRKTFSNNEYVQTIYFNNDEHVLPFELSIKARRYLSASPKSLVLENAMNFLDIKRGKGENKQKKRLLASLKEVVEIVNKEFCFSKTPLRPYVGVVHLRHHYVPKKTGDIRLTLDSNMRYFFFPPGQRKGVEIGEEKDYLRLEIKEGVSNKNFGFLMKKVLGEINAFPIVSKKFTAYNFLGLYFIKTFGKPFYKELKGFEIESKLEVPSEEVFGRIKQFFRESKSDFRLSLRFPYTFESASINRYYKDNDGLFKAMLRRNEAEIVRKSNPEVVENPFGLSCILKRKESKGHLESIFSERLFSAQLLGELCRMRKAFWVENKRSRRFYHISLDCCLGLPGKLYEIEVEYTGKYTDPITVQEKEIVKDIAEITQTLIQKFPEVKPSQLTKQAWLGIN